MKKILIALALALFFQSCARQAQNVKPHDELPVMPKKFSYFLKEQRKIGTVEDGREIYLGGLSGLVFLGMEEEKKNLDEITFSFASITDRGPNFDAKKGDGLPKDNRPFLLPEFTPRILMLKAKNGVIEVENEILLRDPKGKLLTGIPNLAKRDEWPLDMKGDALPFEDFGIDSEGLAQDREENWWVCEEYRPSILKFSKEGVLLKRYVPKGTYSERQLNLLSRKYGPDVVVEALPEDLRMRASNRGFEGVSLSIDDGLVFAALQSSLKMPMQVHERVARIIALDPKKEKTVQQYAYPFDEGVDKIGDITAGYKQDLMVIEQNSKTGPESIHRVYHVKNLVDFGALRPETMTFASLETAGKVLQKTLLIDLVKEGYDSHTKVEGLTLIPFVGPVVVNDNDFGLFDGKDTELAVFPLVKAKLKP